MAANWKRFWVGLGLSFALLMIPSGAAALAPQSVSKPALSLVSAAYTGSSVVSKSLRTGQTLTWRDLSVGIRRVNANDARDRYDDTVTLVGRVPGFSMSFTLQKFDAVYIGNYEIVARDITASGRPGQGRVTLQLRYIPPVR